MLMKMVRRESKKGEQEDCKTYSSRDSHVVTHRSTNLPFNCLCMAERTGCPVFSWLWPYVQEISTIANKYHTMFCSTALEMSATVVSDFPRHIGIPLELLLDGRDAEHARASRFLGTSLHPRYSRINRDSDGHAKMSEDRLKGYLVVLDRWRVVA